MRPVRTTNFALPWFLLGSLAITGTQAAAAEQPLTLMQALERAVAGNVDLRHERVNILLADAGVLTARGQFDFLLGAGLTFQRQTQPSLSSQDISSGFTNDLGLSLQLSRNL